MVVQQPAGYVVQGQPMVVGQQQVVYGQQQMYAPQQGPVMTVGNPDFNKQQGY